MPSVFQPVILSCFLLACCPTISYQQVTVKSLVAYNSIDSFWIHGDIKVTIDRPAHFTRGKKLSLPFFPCLMETSPSKPWEKKCNRVMTGITIFSIFRHKHILYGSNYHTRILLPSIWKIRIRADPPGNRNIRILKI